MVCCSGPNWAVFGKTIEDGQRGQTGFGREPALDVGEVRIEYRFLYGLCMRRWMMRGSLRLHHCRAPSRMLPRSVSAGGLAAAASFPPEAPTCGPSSVWASLIL